MTGYLLKRIIYALIVIWAAYTTTFVLLFALPGDPISIMLAGGGGQDSGGVYGTPEQRAALSAEFGFDKPAIVQYFDRMAAIAQGDFGRSLQTGKPVIEAIGEVAGQTVQLGGAALILAIVLALVIAIAATYNPGSLLSRFAGTLPPLGHAIPTFWSGLMLVQLFAFNLRWLPAIGNRTASALILPAVALAIPTAAVFAQVIIRRIEENLGLPYVRTLKAKGLAKPSIYLFHVLPNAIMPAVTMLGMSVGAILSGAVVTETVFSRAGVGRLFQISVQTQDLYVIQTLVVLSAIVFSVANLLVDLVYPLIDPRLRGAHLTSART